MLGIAALEDAVFEVLDQSEPVQFVDVLQVLLIRLSFPPSTAILCKQDPPVPRLLRNPWGSVFELHVRHAWQQRGK